MKLKYILLIIGFFLIPQITGITTNYYVENSTNVTGYYEPVYFDGDFSTSVSVGTHTTYISYRKPDNAVGALWRQKDINREHLITIFDNCFTSNESYLNLKQEGDFTAPAYLYYYCQNSTGWQPVYWCNFYHTITPITERWWNGTDWQNVSGASPAFCFTLFEEAINFTVDYGIVTYNFSNYTEHEGTNYTRFLNYNLDYGCNDNDNVELYRRINNIYNKTYSLNCSDNTIITDAFSYSTEGQYNISFYFNATNETIGNAQYINSSFISDLNNPTVFLNVTAPDGFANPFVNTSIICSDSIYNNLTYNKTLDSTNLAYGNFSNTTELLNTTLLTDASHTLYGVCSDPFGSTTSTESFTLLAKSIYLIDERTNMPFDVSNLTSVKVYFDDNSSYHDFKSAGNNNVNFTSIENNKLRFELEYSDETIITRYVDVELQSSNIRVCANVEGVTHFEQLITSSVEKRAILKSVFANCVVAADYTRFGYQNAKILKAYTIETIYYLITYDDNNNQVILSSVDGSIAAFINVDNLEFQETAYNFNILQDTLVFEKTNDNEITILYINLDNDNTYANMTIRRMDTNALLFSSDEFDDYNNITVVFNYATLSNINETTLFKIVLTKIDGSGTNTINKYFNINAQTGLINQVIALVIAGLLLLFGLGFTAAGTTFSWFGIFIELSALVFLSLSTAAWYITFFQGITLIILVYTVLIMVSQNQKTISG